MGTTPGETGRQSTLVPLHVWQTRQILSAGSMSGRQLSWAMLGRGLDNGPVSGVESTFEPEFESS